MSDATPTPEEGGKPAAHVLDPMSHGGFVMSGYELCEIEGLPAARKDDAVLCITHGTGRISSFSTTVFIGGQPAARAGDTAICPAQGRGRSLGPGEVYWQATTDAEDRLDREIDTNETIRGPHAEVMLSSTQDEGAEFVARASVARMRNMGTTNVGPLELGGRHSLDVLYGEVEAQHNLLGGGGNAGVGMAREGGSVFVGSAGDGGLNPFAEIGGDYDLLTADADASQLFGYDGRRIGLGGEANAGARVLGGSVFEKFSIPIPFTDSTIEFGSGVGGDLVAASVGAGAWAYWDLETSRFESALSLDIAAVLGFEIDLSFSIGKKRQPPPVAAPNQILIGSPSVWIGDW